MALSRAQLLMGDSGEGPLLLGEVQAVKQGNGISIGVDGVISVNSQTIQGVMKLGQTTATANAAYNGYEWPTVTGTVGQQLTIKTVAAGVTTLEWNDADGIPWTAKGQIVAATGSGTNNQTLVNVGSDGQILIADSGTASGLNYTSNYVATTGATGAANIPAGVQTARPASPVAGALRYNSTTTSLEFYNGTAWESVASSASTSFVEKNSDTGIALIPSGTTGQRPAVNTYTGGFRYNTTLGTVEFSDGVNWQQLVMLNNNSGYNDYVWPNVNGAYGSFLQTDAAGNLSWKNPSFVGNAAPTPASDGMLWYDCATGTLKVFQSCVSPTGWTSVDQSGLPVLPGSMSASPAFSSGSGTSASPYVTSVTTVASGASAIVLNTVTVGGLAPNQYVPVTDLNAVTNEGRFRVTNNYANSAGTLVFDIIFSDVPPSAPATTYTANLRVGYATGYIRSVVNMVSSLAIVSPGTLSGSPVAGQTLNYTPGSATGIGPITYGWVWKDNTNATLQTGGTSYTIPGTLVGKKVYVAFTATDAFADTATSNTTQTSTITQAPFPNWVLGAPTEIPGVVSDTWADGTTSLTSTGCIQISLNGTTFGSGPLSVSNGTTLYMRWNPTGVTCGGAPHGTTITGSITDGTYKNNYSLTLDRNPSAFNFSNLTGQALTSVISSNVITLSGTNAPAYITYTPGATSLTAVQASVGGGAFVNIPLVGTTLAIDPGDTLQIRGTTGSSNNTGYSVTINIGTTTDTWTVTTTNVTPTVATPSITSPTSGSLGLNPGMNCTPGISLGASGFTSSNGAGTDHASSDWEVATDSAFSNIVFSSMNDAVNLTSILVPRANLNTSTTYYCRVRYRSGTAGGGVVTVSSYSSSTYNWSTNNNFVPAIGTAMCGGYFMGQITDGGNTYNLIISPAASGQAFYEVKAGSSNPVLNPMPIDANTTNYVYGKPANDAYNNASYPAFQWARSLSIGGYTDWYIPSFYETNIMYRYFKPNTAVNTVTAPCAYGAVPMAVPPIPTNTAGSPVQTSLAAFRSGGSEALDAISGGPTASASSASSPINCFSLNVSDGSILSLNLQTGTAGPVGPGNNNSMRVIRRYQF